ncbi:hypothetical protein TNIN_263571 [Trichonephila inaurata madagascariensis]|uniref:Uncharacterized protein n=1 Tax=Trichonephila inaurata madagascariensis TaxID=2747483 RepID=A0A8X6IFK6_9ARAC|nr:hypothetical protein TNIN_263491 [Trichonephila inaurata madagascariensis]GFS43188.1 hypothetical protein TNIN_263571 [Trichonephila inaurata madagascariensis]
MLDGFRATAPSFRPLILTSTSSVTIQEKYRFYPLLLSSDVRFPTLELALGALTCTLRLLDGPRMRGTFRHTLNPFTEQRKGVKPCQRASVEVNC